MFFSGGGAINVTQWVTFTFGVQERERGRHSHGTTGGGWAWGKELPEFAGAPFISNPSPVNLRRFIAAIYVVLFVGVVAASGVYFWQTREEYEQLKQQEAASRRRLAETEAKLREQEKIIERLRNDPAYVEKVIRRRLQYAKPDEFVFRFEE